MSNSMLVFIIITCVFIVWFLVGIVIDNKKFWQEEKRKEAERNRKYWQEAGDAEAIGFYENCKN